MQDFLLAATEICLVGGATTAALVMAKSMFYTVKQQSEAIIETFGRYKRTAGPGLQFKLPAPISRVAARLSLRLTQSDFVVQVRTKDNAFVKVPISLHHKITDTRKAYYELNNAVGQMESFASNVVRAKGAQMTLAELYEAQDTIKQAIKTTLDERIGKFGYEIEDVVVSQPEPTAEVKAAFDKVIASLRLLDAAKNEAEAAKIMTVKAAEAEAEAMKAYGTGIANQRIEIARGSQEAVELMERTGLSAEQGVALMVMTNAQESLVKASQGKGSVIVGSVRGEAALDDLENLTARLTALRPEGSPRTTVPAPAATAA